MDLVPHLWEGGGRELQAGGRMSQSCQGFPGFTCPSLSGTVWIWGRGDRSGAEPLLGAGNKCQGRGRPQALAALA